MLLSARRLVQPINNRKSILVVFYDSTQERPLHREHDIFLAETRHRLKNLPAVVRALATQIAVEGRSGEEHRDAFLGRFGTVLKAQDLSLEASKTDLAALIAQTRRLLIDPGPTVTFEPAKALDVSMILHKLMR
jgi:two-component sensor histidine kinase